MTADRLAQALELALRQNEHDMLLTGDEIRQCREALAAHRSQAPAEGDAEFHQLGCLKGMLEDDEGARHSCTCGAKTSPTRDQLFTALNEVAELVGDCEEWAITEDPQVVVGMVKDYMAGVALSKAQPKGTEAKAIGYMNAGQLLELSRGGTPYGYVYPEEGPGARTPVYVAPQAPAPAPEADPCPGCRPGGVCRTPKCGRLKLPLSHPLRAAPTASPAVAHEKTFDEIAATERANRLGAMGSAIRPREDEDARDAARYRVLRDKQYSFGPRITDPANAWLTYTPEGLDQACDDMLTFEAGSKPPVQGSGS